MSTALKNPRRQMELSETGFMEVDGLSQSQQVEKVKTEKYTENLNEYKCFSSRFLRHQLNHKINQGCVTESCSQKVFVCVLFADISGFTQLSSRLCAEELKRHINEYFSLLLHVIHSNHGDVIKFCGDAVLIMWPVPTNGTEEMKSAAVLMASLCALQLMEECGQYKSGAPVTSKQNMSGHYSNKFGAGRATAATNESSSTVAVTRRSMSAAISGQQSASSTLSPSDNSKPVELSLHCGIACGVVSTMILGDGNRHEFILAGDVLQEMGEAEGEAKVGEIGIHRDAYERIKTKLDATPVNNAGQTDPTKRGEVEPAVYILTGRLKENLSQQHQHQLSSAAATVLSPHASSRIDESNKDNPTPIDVDSGPNDVPVLVPPTSGTTECSTEHSDKSSVTHNLCSSLSAKQPFDVVRTTSAKQSSQKSSVSSELSGHGSHDSSSSTLKQSFCLPPQRKSFSGSQELWTFFENKSEISAETERSHVKNETAGTNGDMIAKNGVTGNSGSERELCAKGVSTHATKEPMVAVSRFEPYRLSFSLFSGENDGQHQRRRGFVATYATLSAGGAPLLHFSSARPAFQEQSSKPSALSASLAVSVKKKRVTSFYFPIREDCVTDCGDENGSASMRQQSLSRKGGDRRHHQSSFLSALNSARKSVSKQVRRTFSSFLDTHTVAGDSADEGDEDEDDRNDGGGADRNASETNGDGGMLNDNILHALAYTDGLDGSPGRLSRSTSGSSSPNRKPTVRQLKVKLHFNSDKAVRTVRKYIVSGVYVAIPPTAVMRSDVGGDSKTTSRDVDGGLSLCIATYGVSPPTAVNSSVNSALLAVELRKFVHETALRAIETRTSALLSEMRDVTTLFIQILGLEEDFRVGSHLKPQRVLCIILSIMQRFGGSLRQFVVDDKGCVCIVCFGLFGSSCENNGAQAVDFALALRSALHSVGVKTAVGITTGKVYCGLVGAGHRCEFAVMGASVNLAARLMCACVTLSAAKGVLVDNAVHAAAQTGFVFAQLTSITAKGYAEPVVVFSPKHKLKKSKNPLGSTLTGVTGGSIKVGIAGISTKSATRSSALPPLTHQCSGRYSSSASSKGRKKTARRAHTVSDAKWFAEHRAAALEDPLINDSRAAFVPADVGLDVSFCDRADEMNAATEGLFYNLFGDGSSGTAPSRSLLIYGPSGVGLTTFLSRLRNNMRAESAKNAAKIELISVRCLQCNQYMSYNVMAAILSRVMAIAAESSQHSSESNSVLVSGDNDDHSKAADSLCNRPGKHSLVTSTATKPKLAFKSHTNKASAHLVGAGAIGRRRMSCASGERTTTGSSLTGIIEHSNEGGGRRSSCVNLDRRLSTAHSVSSVDAVTELDASALSIIDQKVYAWCKRMIPESLTVQQAFEFSTESINAQITLPRSIKTVKLLNCLPVLNDVLKCSFPCVDIALYEVLSKPEQHAELCDALVRVVLEVLLSLALGERVGTNPTKPLSAAGNESTVLVMVDDLQWCDVESLAVYTNVSNRLDCNMAETHTSHSKGRGCLVAACNSDDGCLSYVAANDSGTMTGHGQTPKLGSTENSHRALSQRSLIVNAKVSELAESSLCVLLLKLSQSSVSQIVVSKLGSRKWGWLINNYHLTVSGGAPSDSRGSPTDCTARRKSVLGMQASAVIVVEGDLSSSPPSTVPFEPAMPNSRRVSHRSSSFNTIQSMVTETPTDSSMVMRQMHGKTASQKLFIQPRTQHRRPSVVMRQEKSREESIINLIYSLTQHGLPALLHDLIASLNFALDNNRFNGLHQLPVVKQRNKMVLEVVDNLGGVELAVLKAASVVSGAFSASLVSAILVSMGLEMCAETELLENTFGNLVKDGLISMQQTSEATPPFLIISAPTTKYFVFTVESTQSAIYNLMLDSQRVVAHTTVASHLEQSLSECGAVPDVDQLATITTHYLLGDNTAKKIEFLQLSNEQAQRVNDVSEAFGCLSELIYLCTGLHKEELLQKCREQEVASLHLITSNFVPATEDERSECDTESSSGVPIKGRLSLALGLRNPFRNENHCTAVNVAGKVTLTNADRRLRTPFEWLLSCIKRQRLEHLPDDGSAAQPITKPPSTNHGGVSPVRGQWSSSFRFAATSMKVACGSEKYHPEGVEDTDSEWVLAGFVDRDNSGDIEASVEGGEADESSDSDTSTDGTTESSGGEPQQKHSSADDAVLFSTLFKRRRILCNTHSVTADKYCVPYKPHRRQNNKCTRGSHANIKSTGDCADGSSDNSNTDDSSDSSSSGRSDEGLPTVTDHSAAVPSVCEDGDRDPRVDRSVRLLESVIAIKVGLNNLAEWVGSVSMLHYRSGNISEFIEYSALSLYLMELHKEQVTSHRLLTTSTKTEATPKSRILQSLRTFSSKRGFQYRHRTSISSATISGRLFTINSSKSARCLGQARDSIAQIRGGNADHNDRYCITIAGCGNMLRTCLVPFSVVRGVFSMRSRRRVAVDTTPVVVEVASLVLSLPDATTATNTLKTKAVPLLPQVKERFALHAFLCGEPNTAQLLLNELIVEYTQHDVTDMKPSNVLPVTSTASAAACDAATEGVLCGGGVVQTSIIARVKMLLSVVQHSLSTDRVPLALPALDVMTDPHSQAIWHMCAAHYAASEGRFTAAVESLREAMTQFRALREDTSYHFICVQSGWLLVVAGRVEEARAIVHDVQTFIAHTRETCPDDDNSWSALATAVSHLELLCDTCANCDLFDPHSIQFDKMVLHQQADDTAPILCSNIASPDMSDVKSRRNTAVATNVDGAEVEEHTCDSRDRVSRTIRLFAQATVNCDYQQQQRKDNPFCSSSVVDQLCAQLVMYIGYHPVRHPKTAVDKVIKQQMSTVVLANKRKDSLLRSLTVTDVDRLVGNQNDCSNNSNHGLEFVVTTFNEALLFYMTLHTVMCVPFALTTHCKECSNSGTHNCTDCGTGIGPHMVCELLVLTAYGMERFYVLAQSQFSGLHRLYVSLNRQFKLIIARLSCEYTQLAQLLFKGIYTPNTTCDD